MNALKTRDRTFIIFSLILAAIVGGLVGDIIGQFLPDGPAKILFSRAYVIGWDTTTIDLWVITLSIGAQLKINLISVLTMLLVIVYFKWWYL